MLNYNNSIMQNPGLVLGYIILKCLSYGRDKKTQTFRAAAIFKSCNEFKINLIPELNPKLKVITLN